jgi:spore maturation protein CgeB
VTAPRALITGPEWFGDVLPACERALGGLGFNVKCFATNRSQWSGRADTWGRHAGRIPLVGSAVRWRVERHCLHRHTHEINRALKVVLRDWSPEVLLSVLCWRDPLDVDLVQSPSVSLKLGWLMDDPFERDGSLAALARAYQRLYVADASWVEPVRLISGRPTRELTCGADLEAYRPLPPESVSAAMRCGIAFVGTSYAGQPAGTLRRRLLAAVADLDLAIWGDAGWRDSAPELAARYRGGPLAGGQTNCAYNAASAVINIHHPQFRLGTSLRTFAIAAAGAFQLVDARPGLERFFIPGEEIATYATAEELREKALFYLANDSVRARIARAGRERVCREHTYTDRLAEMLVDAGLTPPKHRVWEGLRA